jgi:hypothetical protein
MTVKATGPGGFRGFRGIQHLRQREPDGSLLETPRVNRENDDASHFEPPPARTSRALQDVLNTFEDVPLLPLGFPVFQGVPQLELERRDGVCRIERDERPPVADGDELHAFEPAQHLGRGYGNHRMFAVAGDFSRCDRWEAIRPVFFYEVDDCESDICMDRAQTAENIFGEGHRNGTRRPSVFAWASEPRLGHGVRILAQLRELSMNNLTDSALLRK